MYSSKKQPNDDAEEAVVGLKPTGEHGEYRVYRE